MSHVEALMSWYLEALKRRDGNWAPADMEHAAEDEVIAEAAARGASIDRDDAQVILHREVEATLGAYRGHQTEIAQSIVASAAGARSRGPTDHARRTIPKVVQAATRIRANSKRPASLRTLAELAGIDRGTLADWIRRGWLKLPD